MTGPVDFDVPGIKIRIEASPIATFQAHRQTKFYHREAGGQMFGNIGRARWTLAHVTGPNRLDLRCRYGFRPDRAREQRDIEEFHARGFEYLGDWHTHPEDVPTPSTKDIASIADIVKCSQHHLPGFLLCVVGRLVTPSGIWLSFHDRTGQCYHAKPSGL